MLVNEKDLGLAIGATLKTMADDSYIKNECFIIPNFMFRNESMTEETHYFYVFPSLSSINPNDSCISILQEHIFPKFVKWEKLSESSSFSFISDNYSVWFDVDEEILLYYRLKMRD